MIVDVPDAQASDEETTISVRAKREVSTNITANPEKYQSRLLEQIAALRGRSLDGIHETPTAEASKEVASRDELRSGTRALIAFVAVTTVLSVLLMLFVWSLFVWFL